MTVQAILTRKGSTVCTIEPRASVADAAKSLAYHGIGALVVVDAGGQTVGIISERDIVRALAERGAAALEDPVSRTMTREVETCTAGETVSTIMERMTVGKFRHMPVVEQGRVIGLVSIGDIVKYRLGEMEREQAAMRDYIQAS